MEAPAPGHRGAALDSRVRPCQPGQRQGPAPPPVCAPAPSPAHSPADRATSGPFLHVTSGCDCPVPCTPRLSSPIAISCESCRWEGPPCSRRPRPEASGLGWQWPGLPSGRALRAGRQMSGHGCPSLTGKAISDMKKHRVTSSQVSATQLRRQSPFSRNPPCPPNCIPLSAPRSPLCISHPQTP